MTRKSDNTTRDRGTHIIAEVGGMVDETHATLGIHGPDVEPEEISAELGCAATRAHRRGDERGPGVPAWPQGAWLLTVEGEAPAGPDDVLQNLLSRLPDDPTLWKRLTARYTVRVTVGIFLDAWNRGFELSAASITQLAALRIPIGFDIYADGVKEEDSGASK